MRRRMAMDLELCGGLGFRVKDRCCVEGPVSIQAQSARIRFCLQSQASCHKLRTEAQTLKLQCRYTATALEPTELVVILRNDFEDLVANRPDFIPTYNLGKQRINATSMSLAFHAMPCPQ